MAVTETQLPLTITIAALEVGFRGTPQQLADAIAERIQITAQQTIALISSGATEPTSNIGPWAKNGRTWYYFDDDTGAYVPFIILDSQLKRQISIGEPTDDAIDIWYQIDEDGAPLAIKLKSIVGEAVTWTSVYYLKSEVYTIAQADLAIIKQNRYGVRAQPNAVQNFNIDNAPHKLTMDVEIYDESSVYDDSNYRYTAPLKGIYRVSALARFDDVSGTPAAMQAGVRVWKNGVGSGTQVAAADNNTPSPAGDYWEARISDDILLDAGDFIELAGIAQDGVNSGELQMQVASHWEIHLVQTQA